MWVGFAARTRQFDCCEIASITLAQFIAP